MAAEYRLVMQADVTIRDGDELMFTPNSGAFCQEDRAWAEFCSRYLDQRCILTSVELPPEYRRTDDPFESIASLIESTSRPVFHVRFEDGTEKRIHAGHFTLPAQVTV